MGEETRGRRHQPWGHPFWADGVAAGFGWSEFAV